jgi:hypothetical protein
MYENGQGDISPTSREKYRTRPLVGYAILLLFETLS